MRQSDCITHVGLNLAVGQSQKPLVWSMLLLILYEFYILAHSFVKYGLSISLPQAVSWLCGLYV